MKEKVLRIGKPQALTAIASIPEKNLSADMAVVIVNAGVMHHIGPSRNSVRVARELAQSGYLALRFDFSGIGDSVPRSGTQWFTLMGLCSGADTIYETALQDERVHALCQIDPFCYRTPRWKFNYWLARLSDPGHWLRFLKRRVSQLKEKSKNKSREGNVELPTYIRDFPPRTEVRDGLNKLFKRNVRLLALFTNGQTKIYNYEKQFVDSMPDVDFKDLFTTAYYKNCSHIINEPDQQFMVTSKIINWVRSHEEKEVQETSDELVGRVVTV